MAFVFGGSVERWELSEVIFFFVQQQGGEKEEKRS